MHMPARARQIHIALHLASFVTLHPPKSLQLRRLGGVRKYIACEPSSKTFAGLQERKMTSRHGNHWPGHVTVVASALVGVEGLVVT